LWLSVLRSIPLNVLGDCAMKPEAEAPSMSAHCCHDATCSSPRVDPRFRKALWIAMVVNAAMFVVEFGVS
jgi:hypothetical protein